MKGAVFVLILISWYPGIHAEEIPVIGGPCEGCDLVFEGMPDRLASKAHIAAADEQGEPLIIEGTVKAPDGSPAPDIIVYAYHTDKHGIYPKGRTQHGRLRGWARTDKNGYYRFDTIRPGSYPNTRNPQHVHMHVIEPSRATYYIDDIIFEDDPLLTKRSRENMQRGRGGFGLTDPKKDEQGVWRVRRDILLGKNVPGYD